MKQIFVEFHGVNSVLGSKEFEAENIEIAIKQIEKDVVEKPIIYCRPNAMASYYACIRTSAISRFLISEVKIISINHRRYMAYIPKLMIVYITNNFSCLYGNLHSNKGYWEGYTYSRNSVNYHTRV